QELAGKDFAPVRWVASGDIDVEAGFGRNVASRSYGDVRGSKQRRQRRAGGFHRASPHDVRRGVEACGGIDRAACCAPGDLFVYNTSHVRGELLGLAYGERDA